MTTDKKQELGRLDVQPSDDPVEEIRRIRDEHARSLGYDVQAIYDDIKRFERDQKFKLSTLPIKRIGKTG